MLGYVMMAGRGESDAVLCALADRLISEGRRLAGAVQINRERPGASKCHMELKLLPSGESRSITQALGEMSQGCRLDAEGLELAVAQAERALEAGAELVVINKFGKQEVAGRGFRALIAEALHRGVPVILGVNEKNLHGFDAFAGDIAEPLAPDLTVLLEWCHAKLHVD